MDLIPLIPPLVALILILITRKAALSLFAAALTASFLIAGPHPITAIRNLFEDHIIKVVGSSAWNLSAIIFTLTLGAFATLLEKGGGFTAILQKLLSSKTKDPQKKLLFGIYGLGLLCFFDGLANAILLGRVSRPLTDGLRISRQFLAYLIDSTSATVACVAFISTWIAAQLACISESLEGAPFEVNPATLFFSSIPSNPYCLLTLFLIPLVIHRNWLIGPMKNALPFSLDDNEESIQKSSPGVALFPLAVLIAAIPTCIYLWQDGSDWSWRNAFTSKGVPYAMITAGFIALTAALVFFPKERRRQAPKHMLSGAASLIPALFILIGAWTLGSLFVELKTAELLTHILSGKLSATSVPLAIFLVGAVMSFFTGSSWGTFGLLMPIALPLALKLGVALPQPDLIALVSMTIGAVFGGAVFGDHCSPFSDTTIVSSISAGCSPTSHVATQLPYALITAGGAALAYFLMSLGVAGWFATFIVAGLLAALVLLRKVKG